MSVTIPKTLQTHKTTVVFVLCVCVVCLFALFLFFTNICNPGTEEAETGGSGEFKASLVYIHSGQPGLQSETLSQNTKTSS